MPQRNELEVPFTELVLVCNKCEGARKGPSASDIRKGLKKRLGKPKSLRVLEVECLALCPDDGVALCVARASGQGFETRVIRSTPDLDALAAALAREQGAR